MIGVSDIGNILYRDCGAFRLDVFQKGNIPKGGIKAERIVIYPKAQSPDVIWKESYVEVNLCVPDIEDGTANLIRLHELEAKAHDILGDAVGSYNGSDYAYHIDSVGVERDEDMRCHYVNVSILFEVLNIN